MSYQFGALIARILSQNAELQINLIMLDIEDDQQLS